MNINFQILSEFQRFFVAKTDMCYCSVLLVTQVVQKTVKWIQLAPSFIFFCN